MSNLFLSQIFIPQLSNEPNFPVAIQQLGPFPLPIDPFIFPPLFPLQTNPPYSYIPPHPSLRTHAYIHASISPSHFDGNLINEYFDFSATPPDQRLGLLSLFMQGQLSPWMWAGPLRFRIQNPEPQAVATSSPPWTDLPGDLTANILRRLGPSGMLFTAQRVCNAWWKASKDPALWRVIDFSDPIQGKWTHKYTAMCRHAVDLSQGQLVDLTVQYFGDDALMDYIVDRSLNLKRLKLGACFSISGYCATRIAPKLGHLEELHLTLRPCIGVADIEAIGYSCPMLKSFSCNGSKYEVPTSLNGASDEVYYRNMYAFAISRSMPYLQHLQLFGHWIGNEGLETILDSCPNLESLDIRQCFDLDLGGDLGERCHQRMKHLKLPNDSVSDVPWPNCDGGDPFSPSALMFEYYVYDHYKDHEDYYGRYEGNFN
ncbi:putative F-box protein At4g05475 [Salvia splendens]|uniref:putative F-box protein At4g05475 n=1 Tax=Salvia splendens TaxID=180675 RepID=UPI001C2565D5|nr:putative F-box protein At4g05475 [Salvia splendens]